MESETADAMPRMTAWVENSSNSNLLFIPEGDTIPFKLSIFNFQLVSVFLKNPVEPGRQMCYDVSAQEVLLPRRRFSTI